MIGEMREVMSGVLRVEMMEDDGIWGDDGLREMLAGFESEDGRMGFGR